MANPEHVAILKQGVEVWNRWRDENGQIVPDLSKIDLSRADLRNANLRGTNMEYSGLSHAKCAAARLWSAQLRGAILQHADLSFADFSFADLSSADLRSAMIGCTYFRNTILEGCHFGCARASYTVLINVDLSNINGIAEIAHHRPSSVDTGTLVITANSLTSEPTGRDTIAAFLRGTGVPERMIQLFQEMTRRHEEFYSCYICHENEVLAERVHDQLQARGIRCWLYKHQVLPGDHILDQIDRGIRAWDKVLLCCSRLLCMEMPLNSTDMAE
jgi:hypothetical protein